MVPLLGASYRPVLLPHFGTPQTYTALDGAGWTQLCSLLRLETTIDDTYAFGYPEDVTRGSHHIRHDALQFVANPSKRLRHGKTFINNVQQPLDAPF